MRTKVIFESFVALIVIVLVTATVFAVKRQNSLSQTCNGTGVVIRADGSVLIDNWKTFDPSVMNSAPGPQQFPKPTNNPSKVTFGKDVNAMICFESDTETHCITMSKLRAFK